MKDLLKQIDEAQVREAVSAAETRTAGEIVPYVVPRSADYAAAVWRGAAGAATAAMAAAVLVFQFYDGWGLAWLHAGWGVALLALASGTAGALLTAFVAPLKRLLTSTAALERAVHQRAMQAFVEEEVFATRDRTGILLFVSLFEHRIEVVGDEGINRAVTPEDWMDVVERIRQGVRSGRLTDGLVEAIEMCGALLEESGVEIRPDDTNELSDDVRLPKDDE